VISKCDYTLLYIFAYEFLCLISYFWEVEQNSDGAFSEVDLGLHDDVYTLLQFTKFIKDISLLTNTLISVFLCECALLLLLSRYPDRIAVNQLILATCKHMGSSLPISSA
jgi:hypothetical protein